MDRSASPSSRESAQISMLRDFLVTGLLAFPWKKNWDMALFFLFVIVDLYHTLAKMA
jgi:hypothetical protein